VRNGADTYCHRLRAAVAKRWQRNPALFSGDPEVIELGAFHVECHKRGAQGPQARDWTAAEKLWNAGAASHRPTAASSNERMGMHR